MNGVGRALEDLALQFAYAVWRRRWLIALPVLILPFVGVAAARLAPKDYVATTTLLVQEAAKINPFLEDLAIPAGLAGRMEALVEQMRTRAVLTAVATDVGRIAPGDAPQTVDRALDDLRHAIRIRLTGQEVVEIGVVADAPQGLGRVTAAVSARFVDQLLAPARSSVEASERFLAAERARFTAELETAEAGLAAFKTDNAEALPALHVQNVQALAETRRQIADLSGERAGVAARIDLGARRLAATDPVLGGVDQRLATLEAELAGLLVRYAEGHGAVRRARAEIAALTERRRALEAQAAETPSAADDAERLWNMLSADRGENRSLMQDQLGLLEEARARIDRLDAQIATLAAAEADLAGRVRRFAAVEREIAAFERDVEVKRRLLDRIAERHEMARVTAALGRESAPELVRVIDAPEDPIAPAAWPLIVYVLAGVAGGVALGAGLAFGAEMLDTTVTRPALAAELVGLPVLGRLPAFPVEALRLAAAAPLGTAPS
jgi:polysaccharide chain length determinant protein (PEP-CTERM system associated)